jgi:hypothetical protein
LAEIKRDEIKAQYMKGKGLHREYKMEKTENLEEMVEYLM